MSVYCIEPEKCTRNLLIHPKDVRKNEKKAVSCMLTQPLLFWVIGLRRRMNRCFIFYRERETRHATSLQFVLSRQLLNDCFDSLFTFNGYNNYTLRSGDCCVVRSQNCVSNDLA